MVTRGLIGCVVAVMLVAVCLCGIAAAAEWVQETKLLASDPSARDWFGRPVALSGEVAAIAAVGDDEGGADTGAVCIFQKTGEDWEEVTRLIPLEAEPHLHFGDALAVDGSLVVAGSPGGEAAWVFEQTPTGWQQTGRLTADDAFAGQCFGSAVAVCGDTVVVGAHGDDAGSAYVFERDGQTWTQAAKLTAYDGQTGYSFGDSVALQEDTVVVGATQADGLCGAAYVFRRDESTWTSAGKLSPADGAEGDGFGADVHVLSQAGTVFIGSPYDDDRGDDSGSVYVFVDNGVGWSQSAKLTVADGEAADSFGWSLAAEDDRVVIGAFHEDLIAGAVYVFSEEGSSWEQAARLTASDAALEDYFGYSVAMSGTTILVGAQGNDDAFDLAGSAYVFSKEVLRPGDANGDGKVDGTDLASWQVHYDPLGSQPTDPAMGDFNGDGRIDGVDLAIWQQNYDPLGTASAEAVSTVPEPATLLLVGLGLLAGLSFDRHRRRM